MTKAQQFSQWLGAAAAKHPNRAKAVAWTITGMLVLLPITVIWRDLSEGKFLKVITVAVGVVVAYCLHYRQAKRFSSANS